MRFLLLPALAASALAADFPAPFNTETASGGPMPPDQAAASVRTPPGFHVTMFAAEPHVQQPIAIATDSRGRLWVAECYTYAESKVNYDTKLRDRIVIFEDADNDGHFDKRTVFWDQAERLTSVELGFGGVWAACAPNLLFIPDKNGDDIPDGPPEILLDGWDTGPIRHNIVNGLRWGPDGWLYGRHGILATSLVGAPGTPTAQRTKMNVGIWRFHPTRKVFEVVANGTTNPWGMDWNEVGEAFFTNTVTGHLWHLIPGAHYERMYGEDANPHVYQLMGMCADHYHFDTGAGWTKSRATFDGAPASASDALGGGHAHCGCLIYQGDQWPDYWRGKVLTINFHGRRLNVERLEHSGSGYVAKHEPDAFFFGDPWFRGIDLIQAPDGGVFVADWSDASECHDNDGVHRTSGRIYKITYGDGKRVAANPGSTLVPSVGLGVPPRRTSETVEKAESVTADAASKKVREGGTPSPTLGTSVLPGDVAKLGAEELGRALLSPNRWLAEQAVHVLSDVFPENRGGEERAFAALTFAMKAVAEQKHSPQTRLRVMRVAAALVRDGFVQLKVATLRELAGDNESLRMWIMRYLVDEGYGEDINTLSELALGIPASGTPPNPLPKFRTDSAACRTLISLLPHLPSQRRAALARDIAAGDFKSRDTTAELLFWYAVETLADGWIEDFIEIVRTCDSPLIRRFGARRLAEDIDAKPGRLAALLGQTNEIDATKPDVISGIADGLKGRSRAQKPETWIAYVSSLKNPSAELAASIRSLGAVFGDGRALDEIRAIALDSKAEIPARRQALQSLIDARTPDLRAVCEQSLEVRDLAGVAARGLAHFDDPKIGALLLQKYGGMYAHLRPEAMGALSSRPAWAALLLDAIANGQIARTDLGAFHARQIRAFNDDTLTKRLAEVWGDVRETGEAKKALIAKLKAQLTPGVLAKADLPAGRALFTQTCAVCHKLYGEGGALGPDLTGSAREISYLVENIADPSAVVPVDFRLSIVTMKDGRVLSGFVGGKTERGFTLRGLTDTQTIERAEVKEIADSPQSLMPEGVLEALSETQVRDLLGYLMTKSQVPLPDAAAKN